MLEIIPIPALKDNYIWLGINRELAEAFIVDPGEAPPVLAYLKQHALTPTAILVTHKHADHTGGIAELVTAYPDLQVYAHPLEKVTHVTHQVKDGEILTLSRWPEPFNVIHIPGHTLGHVAYYAKLIVFSGDTLFCAGCGRVFEGTAEQMLSSLDKLAALPDDTLVYCGHEYTLNNLRFAAMVEPENSDIAKRYETVKELRNNNSPTVPSTMQIEHLTNPFLRCKQNSVIKSVEKHVNHALSDTVSVFHQLREWKIGVKDLLVE